MSIADVSIIALAFASIGVIWLLTRRRAPAETDDRVDIDHGITLYFRDGFLINASDAALSIFDDLQIPWSDRGIQWILDAMGCDIAENKYSSEIDQHFNCANGTQVHLKVTGDRAALNIKGANNSSANLLTLALSTHLARIFRAVADTSPNAVAIHNRASQRIYENDSYRTLLDDQEFEDALTHGAPLSPSSNSEVEQQISYKTGRQDKHFDLRRLEHDGYIYDYIQDASSRFYADQSSRTFRKTMSQTFADLSVGLAVFDTEQHLIAFNPALVDLLDLPVSFLVQRPSLFSFFAQLREDRTMPEPLSFADWQDNLLQLVKGAKDGDFNETWHRLDGKALRVMGRPQPEGSFAFLVEDVTNEIKLNKSVSDQLDLYQSAMDGLDAAIGVFDAAKTLIISNTMFNDLFDIPETDEIYILKLDQWLKTLQPTVSQEFLYSLSTASLSETVIQSKAPDQTFKLNARSLKNGQLIITLTPRTPVFRTTLSRYEKGLMTHE